MKIRNNCYYLIKQKKENPQVSSRSFVITNDVSHNIFRLDLTDPEFNPYYLWAIEPDNTNDPKYYRIINEITKEYLTAPTDSQLHVYTDTKNPAYNQLWSIEQVPNEYGVQYFAIVQKERSSESKRMVLTNVTYKGSEKGMAIAEVSDSYKKSWEIPFWEQLDYKACSEADNFLIPDKQGPIKAAVFTAHPDDETIWMGGTILLKNDWEWDIHVATNKNNVERNNEINAAIAEYKEKSGNQNINLFFDEIMPDTDKQEEINDEEVYCKLDEIVFSKYDIIFTHNTDGEYGHNNHKVLGEYFKAKAIAIDNRLNIWHFLCPGIQNPKEKQIGEYIESIYLNPETRQTKEKLFVEAYTSQEYLWKNFDDFMNFQFHSGRELFTCYKKSNKT